jgi:hypothetical protein
MVCMNMQQIGLLLVEVPNKPTKVFISHNNLQPQLSFYYEYVHVGYWDWPPTTDGFRNILHLDNALFGGGCFDTYVKNISQTAHIDQNNTQASKSQLWTNLL